MRNYLLPAAAVLLLSAVLSCSKNDEFSYETAEEVDLGLSVVWAGRNYGAAESAECGRVTLFGTDPFAGDWSLPGEGWRMPTCEEWEELNGCPSRIVKVGTRNAICFTGPSGKSLLLPFAGVVAGDPGSMHDLLDNVWMRYWSSTDWSTDPAYAVAMTSRKDTKLLPEPHLKGVPASLRLVRLPSSPSAGL